MICWYTNTYLYSQSYIIEAHEYINIKEMMFVQLNLINFNLFKMLICLHASIRFWT